MCSLCCVFTTQLSINLKSLFREDSHLSKLSVIDTISFHNMRQSIRFRVVGLAFGWFLCHCWYWVCTRIKSFKTTLCLKSIAIITVRTSNTSLLHGLRSIIIYCNGLIPVIWWEIPCSIALIMRPRTYIYPHNPSKSKKAVTRVF
jgi:hypothetical protein